MKASQQGFALITMMLVVALVALLSSQILSSQQAQVLRSGFMMHQAQSLAVLWGLESWVKQGLKLDVDDNKVDHLQEIWASPIPPIDFAGGDLSGWLEDEQGRINLNNVLSPDEADRKFWQAVMNRWLQQQNSRWPLFDLVKDWADQDGIPESFGAESDAYQLQEPSYSAGNHPLVSTQEVMMLQEYAGLEESVKVNLQEDFSALPKITPINVNTASERVLIALADWMNATVVEAWIQQREQTPAESVAEFKSFVQSVSGLSTEEMDQAFPKNVLSVQSEFFSLHAQLNYGSVSQGVFGLFYREKDKGVHLIQRWLSQQL
jgi:general secretion pathway protein K